jgi:6-phosphogluconolactonase
MCAFMFIYAACLLKSHPSQVDDFDTGASGKGTGGISAYAIDAETGRLKLLNSMATGGADPCFVSTTCGPNETSGSGKDGATTVLCANYSGGSVASFSTLADGSLAALRGFVQFVGSGPHLARQEAAHAHQILLHHRSCRVYVADLGSDLVRQLHLTGEGEFEELQSSDKPLQGGGPRHIAFHPTLEMCYCLHELANMISVLPMSSESLLDPVQHISTLPPDFGGHSLAADIHVSPDGCFLYASNRGHDSIAIYKVAGSEAEKVEHAGQLSLVSFCSTGAGSTPRNFALTPCGNFALVACQDEHTIKTYARDQSCGLLSPTPFVARVGSPVCISLVSTGGSCDRVHQGGARVEKP